MSCRRTVTMDILNEVQLSRLEEEFQSSRRRGESRPPKHRSRRIAWVLNRWFTNRTRDYDGKPRLQWKTPDQLVILEESFTNNPYPDCEELLRIIRLTLLSTTTRQQVTNWFCTQRKKYPEVTEERWRQAE
ncbi:hypothetical protein AURDEDRAFT_119521 [Auricularia subglabra TFB-10046 SS5]|nr:hypothetical protein AURDEDRAFT_119521 [Auricularia subglabra TFB-10046 SS5]